MVYTATWTSGSIAGRKSAGHSPPNSGFYLIMIEYYHQDSEYPNQIQTGKMFELFHGQPPKLS